MEAWAGIEPAIRVLQTLALPLGYGPVHLIISLYKEKKQDLLAYSIGICLICSSLFSFGNLIFNIPSSNLAFISSSFIFPT